MHLFPLSAWIIVSVQLFGLSSMHACASRHRNRFARLVAIAILRQPDGKRCHDVLFRNSKFEPLDVFCLLHSVQWFSWFCSTFNHRRKKAKRRSMTGGFQSVVASFFGNLIARLKICYHLLAEYFKRSNSVILLSSLPQRFNSCLQNVLPRQKNRKHNRTFHPFIFLQTVAAAATLGPAAGHSSCVTRRAEKSSNNSARRRKYNEQPHGANCRGAGAGSIEAHFASRTLHRQRIRSQRNERVDG